MTFAELVGVPVTRQMVIVTFLAVLELIRQRRLRVRQEALRGEILVGLLPAAAPEAHLPALPRVKRE